jgi:hypothetical protein
MLLNETHQKRLLTHALFLKEYADRQVNEAQKRYEGMANVAYQLAQMFSNYCELVWHSQMKVEEEYLERVSAEQVMISLSNAFKELSSKMIGMQEELQNQLLPDQKEAKAISVAILDCLKAQNDSDYVVSVSKSSSDLQDKFTLDSIISLLAQSANIQDMLGAIRIYTVESAGGSRLDDLDGGKKERSGSRVFEQLQRASSTLLPVINNLLNISLKPVTRSQSMNHLSDNDSQAEEFGPLGKAVMAYILGKHSEVKELQAQLDGIFSKA